MLCTVIPLHTLAPLRSELRAALVRLRTRRVRRKYAGARDLLVNLGVGNTGRSGWVNVDLCDQPGVNCIWDCRKSLPFPDVSVRGIFCEHFFEHIDYTEEVPYFLSECHRVLKPGGVIRIVVPDVERYLRAYCSGGWEELARIRPLDAERRDFHNFTYNTPMELINEVFRQGYTHKYAYDYQTLQFLLLKYGFSTVTRQEFGNTMMEDPCLDEPTRRTESLYVEAVK